MKNDLTNPKPYIILKGSYQNLSAFEDKITEAFEAGYLPASELQVHPIQDAGKTIDLVLLQSLVLNLDEDDDDNDEEEDDDDEDYD